MINLTASELRRAADVQDEIQSLQRELSALLGGKKAGGPGSRKGRWISSAGRARIAAAQRARWAKTKTTGKKVSRRGKMSAAGRARIAAAAKARWAKAKAAGKNRL